MTLAAPVGSRAPVLPSPKVISRLALVGLAQRVHALGRSAGIQRRHLLPQLAIHPQFELGATADVRRAGKVGYRRARQPEALERPRRVAVAERLLGLRLAVAGVGDIAVEHRLGQRPRQRRREIDQQMIRHPARRARRDRRRRHQRLMDNVLGLDQDAPVLVDAIESGRQLQTGGDPAILRPRRIVVLAKDDVGRRDLVDAGLPPIGDGAETIAKRHPDAPAGSSLQPAGHGAVGVLHADQDRTGARHHRRRRGQGAGERDPGAPHLARAGDLPELIILAADEDIDPVGAGGDDRRPLLGLAAEVSPRRPGRPRPPPVDQRAVVIEGDDIEAFDGRRHGGGRARPEYRRAAPTPTTRRHSGDPPQPPIQAHARRHRRGRRPRIPAPAPRSGCRRGATTGSPPAMSASPTSPCRGRARTPRPRRRRARAAPAG